MIPHSKHPLSLYQVETLGFSNLLDNRWILGPFELIGYDQSSLWYFYAHKVSPSTNGELMTCADSLTPLLDTIGRIDWRFVGMVKNNLTVNNLQDVYKAVRESIDIYNENGVTDFNDWPINQPFIWADADKQAGFDLGYNDAFVLNSPKGENGHTEEAYLQICLRLDQYADLTHCTDFQWGYLAGADYYCTALMYAEFKGDATGLPDDYRELTPKYRAMFEEFLASKGHSLQQF